MSKQQSNSKRYNTLVLVGSLLLLFMAGFHGSGTNYMNSQVIDSNIPEFIKPIFPVLFVHISIHLVSLAALGILALFMNQEAYKLLIVIAIAVLIDAIIAFYLGALPPGILLSLSAICFLIASRLR